VTDDLVITVAPCGAETMRSHNPAVPYAVRGGFEDQIEADPGVAAPSNATLVERVVAIAALLGRRPASPARAREILRLPAAS